MKTICIPLRARSQKEMLGLIRVAQGQADMLELWLDGIPDLDVQALLRACRVPVICVCKKISEGGRFKGSYAKVSAILMGAMKAGADYVDVPLKMGEKLIKKIVHEQKKYSKCRLILSHHDFKKTPPLMFLLKQVDRMKMLGADIVKIVTFAGTRNDAITIMALSAELKDNGTAHVVLAMGRHGVLSRLLTPLIASAFMFAPLQADSSTAAGQLTAGELRRAWKVF